MYIQAVDKYKMLTNNYSIRQFSFFYKVNDVYFYNMKNLS